MPVMVFRRHFCRCRSYLDIDLSNQTPNTCEPGQGYTGRLTSSTQRYNQCVIVELLTHSDTILLHVQRASYNVHGVQLIVYCQNDTKFLIWQLGSSAARPFGSLTIGIRNHPYPKYLRYAMCSTYIVQPGAIIF